MDLFGSKQDTPPPDNTQNLFDLNQINIPNSQSSLLYSVSSADTLVLHSDLEYFKKYSAIHQI
jgi:hypothetical protein